MGCYNGEGCISGLPIECGDPIGGIICVSTKDYDDNEMITPVWPIIWGEYDDYGGIEMSSIDCELEEYFGNRKNLLKDLERVTHGCRHQIEDGIPEGICLLLEHEDVLKTLIACGNPKEIEESIKAGQPMYQLDFEPIGLQGRVDNIYRRGWCYFDNEMFLKCFRNYKMETEIKITEEKAYDYARPAAKTLYRQGFIKETWLVEMLAQAFLAGAACASTAHWERVDDKSNVPQGPQLLCAKKNRYGWFMHLCRYDGEDFFNEHCDSYHPTHYMVVPPIIQTENE